MPDLFVESKRLRPLHSTKPSQQTTFLPRRKHLTKDLQPNHPGSQPALADTENRAAANRIWPWRLRSKLEDETPNQTRTLPLNLGSCRWNLPQRPVLQIEQQETAGTHLVDAA